MQRSTIQAAGTLTLVAAFAAGAPTGCNAPREYRPSQALLYQTDSPLRESEPARWSALSFAVGDRAGMQMHEVRLARSGRLDAAPVIVRQDEP